MVILRPESINSITASSCLAPLIQSFPAPGPIIADQCAQLRLACSVGASPTGVIVRNPVTWITREEETNLVKLIDKAIFRMVSESPGRNESEPIGGPDKKKKKKNYPRRPSPLVRDEGNMDCRNLTDTAVHSDGVVGTAR